MNTLEKIINFKKQELVKLKQDIPLNSLVKSPSFKRSTHSLKEALSKEGSKGIIAEFKRQSPSKGIINKDADIKQVTESYLNAGASAQSILTDTAFFGGSIMDLIEARTVNSNVPILRKDFIVDAFQIVESKAIGADAILLIAACLTAKELKQFGGLASDLGLEVLYEVHDRSDMDKLDVSDGLIGINNRDLKTFKVDLENSIEMVKELPSATLKVAESGISDPKIVTGLRQYGFDGFLIGEQFMKSNDPGGACKDFIDQLD